MESSAAEEVESVPSSETVEAVLALEVPLAELVELLPPPEQAAMLRARVRAKKPARSFFRRKRQQMQSCCKLQSPSLGQGSPS